MVVRTKRAEIWNYFTVDVEEVKFARCNTCSDKVSRGGNTAKSFNTTNLVNHLKKQHTEVYEEFTEKNDQSLEKGKQKSSLKQMTLREARDRVKSWDINDSRAQVMHRRVIGMVALDSLPFSIVEDVGFVRFVTALEPRYSLPSRKYLTSTILPQIYNETVTSVQELMTAVDFFSFTTDAWSADNAVAALLSLTAHWLTESFERMSAVLNVLPLDESHTGQYLAKKYEEMLASWKIPLNEVHLVLRDNAANMVKAMRDSALPSFGCFAHSLQLVVNDEVLAQQAVLDLLATCRKIVGHF